MTSVGQFHWPKLYEWTLASENGSFWKSVQAGAIIWKEHTLCTALQTQFVHREIKSCLPQGCKANLRTRSLVYNSPCCSLPNYFWSCLSLNKKAPRPKTFGTETKWEIGLVAVFNTPAKSRHEKPKFSILTENAIRSPFLQSSSFIATSFVDFSLQEVQQWIYFLPCLAIVHATDKVDGGKLTFSAAVLLIS